MDRNIILSIAALTLLMSGAVGLIYTIGPIAFLFLLVFVWGNNVERKIK